MYVFCVTKQHPGETNAAIPELCLLFPQLQKWFNLRRDENLPAASHVEGTETHQLVQSSIPDPGGIERGLRYGGGGGMQSCMPSLGRSSLFMAIF